MNTPLQQAAKAMIDRWESPDWKDTPHTAHYIEELRKALDAELAQSVEPVAYGDFANGGNIRIWTRLATCENIKDLKPLYLHPPQPQATTPAVPTLTETLAQQGIKLRTEFEPKQQDKTSLTDVPEGIKALLCVKPKIVTGPCGQCGSSADPCYCGNVNTGEPSGERAELIARLRTGWTVMEESEFERLDDLCRKAADMLEADAQQAKPPYDQQALELCNTCGWKGIFPGDPCLVCAQQAKRVPMTDAEAHQTLLDMAANIEKFGDGTESNEQLSSECIRFILERVDHHGITPTEKPTDWGQP